MKNLPDTIAFLSTIGMFGAAWNHSIGGMLICFLIATLCCLISFRGLIDVLSFPEDSGTKDPAIPDARSGPAPYTGPDRRTSLQQPRSEPDAADYRRAELTTRFEYDPPESLEEFFDPRSKDERIRDRKCKVR